MKHAVTWMIIFATCGLVIVPVATSQLRFEVARWHLASATNALETDSTDPQKGLDAAAKWVAPLEQMLDYWLFRIKRSVREDPTEVPELVRQAVGRDRDFRELGDFAVYKLVRRQEWYAAVEVLEATLTEQERQLPSVLNELAYFRALAARDLDQALEDINTAVEQRPNDPNMRDTRAWVLFQMGNPLEALPDIEFAVEESKPKPREGMQAWMSRFEEWMLDNKSQTDAGEQTEDVNSFSRRIDPRVFSHGVIRYHRTQILEALGRQEEAGQDWKWLTENGFPDDGQGIH